MTSRKLVLDTLVHPAARGFLPKCDTVEPACTVAQYPESSTTAVTRHETIFYKPTNENSWSLPQPASYTTMGAYLEYSYTDELPTPRELVVNSKGEIEFPEFEISVDAYTTKNRSTSLLRPESESSASSIDERDARFKHTALHRVNNRKTSPSHDPTTAVANVLPVSVLLSKPGIHLDKAAISRVRTKVLSTINPKQVAEWVSHLMRTVEYIDAKLQYYSNNDFKQSWRILILDIPKRTQAYGDVLGSILDNGSWGDQACTTNGEENNPAGCPSSSMHLRAISILLNLPNQKLIPNKLKKKIQEELCILALGYLDDLTSIDKIKNLVRLYCIIPKLIKITPIPVLELLQLAVIAFQNSSVTADTEVLDNTRALISDKIQVLFSKSVHNTMTSFTTV